MKTKVCCDHGNLLLHHVSILGRHPASLSIFIPWRSSFPSKLLSIFTSLKYYADHQEPYPSNTLRNKPPTSVPTRWYPVSLWRILLASLMIIDPLALGLPFLFLGQSQKKPSVAILRLTTLPRSECEFAPSGHLPNCGHQGVDAVKGHTRTH